MDCIRRNLCARNCGGVFAAEHEDKFSSKAEWKKGAKLASEASAKLRDEEERRRKKNEKRREEAAMKARASMMNENEYETMNRSDVQTQDLVGSSDFAIEDSGNNLGSPSSDRSIATIPAKSYYINDVEDDDFYDEPHTPDTPGITIAPGESLSMHECKKFRVKYNIVDFPDPQCTPMMTLLDHWNILKSADHTPYLDNPTYHELVAKYKKEEGDPSSP